MARRKKAPDGFHKNQIITAAEQLFMEKGIEGTSMDDISKKSGYGKATIYVYFKNKEEMIITLALKSMKKLLERIQIVVHEDKTIKEQYFDICRELVLFQKEYPQYFIIAISKINVDSECDNNMLKVEEDTFIIGEKINDELKSMLKCGIERGELRDDILIDQTIFVFWAAISGIITMSHKKDSYIHKTMDIDREQLLDYSFRLLFESIRKERK